MRILTSLALCLAALTLTDAAQAAACKMPANQAELIRQVVTLANAQRARAGLPGLQISAALNKAALSLACDMQKTGRFSHTGANGSTLSSRAKAAGCNWKRTMAENIGWGYRTPQAAVAGWMGSTAHKANLLNRKVTLAGVAFVPAANGGYWVMDFAGGC